MIGGCSAVGRDVPPYMRAAGGYRAHLYGLNTIGLKRQGFTNDRISALKQAYEILFRSGLMMAEALKRVREEFKGQPDVQEVVAFVEGTKRGICKSVGAADEEDE
jgi:UDP-N-acetylglucosamine acyltransferase